VFSSYFFAHPFTQCRSPLPLVSFLNPLGFACLFNPRRPFPLERGGPQAEVPFFLDSPSPPPPVAPPRIGFFGFFPRCSFFEKCFLCSFTSFLVSCFATPFRQPPLFRKCSATLSLFPGGLFPRHCGPSLPLICGCACWPALPSPPFLSRDFFTVPPPPVLGF